MARKKKTRRKFSAEYKAEVVALVQASDKSVSEICRDLGLGETSVRRWLDKAESSETKAHSKGADELARENSELRKRVTELEMERAILKKQLGQGPRLHQGGTQCPAPRWSL